MRATATKNLVLRMLMHRNGFVNLRTGDAIAFVYDGEAYGGPYVQNTWARHGRADVRGVGGVEAWGGRTSGRDCEAEGLWNMLHATKAFRPTPEDLEDMAGHVVDPGQGDDLRWWACGAEGAAAAAYALGECRRDPAGTLDVLGLAESADDPVRPLEWAGASDFGRRVTVATNVPPYSDVSAGYVSFVAYPDVRDPYYNAVRGTVDVDGKPVTGYAPQAQEDAAWALSAQAAYDVGIRGDALRSMVRDRFPRPLPALRAGAALLGLPCCLEGPLGAEARRRGWDVGGRAGHARGRHARVAP